jgi:antitoxin (DNA-binding transcriptional repressor) of toxin-antitoxin stability system
METVNIRSLRGTSVARTVGEGKPLAITNNKALIAVVIPVARGWVEHVINRNWSQVRQHVKEGEKALASGAPMDSLDNVVADPGAARGNPGGGDPRPDGYAVPLVAALAGRTVTQSPESRQLLAAMQAALTGPARATEKTATDPQPVRVGDLSAHMIEEAGEARQTLALTHDRQLIGIVIPVTPRLVHFLIEQNLSRIQYNIALGEKELTKPEAVATLAEAAGQDAPGGNSRGGMKNADSAGRISST